MRRIYPWEEWFSKERTVLMRGIHYRCSQSTMVQTIRNNASQRGIKGVSVHDTDTEIVIEVKNAGAVEPDRNAKGDQIVPDVRGTVQHPQLTVAGAGV